MLKLAPALFPLLLLLAACGGGDTEGEGNRAAARPAPTSTLPPPRTPVMQVTPAAGDEPTWLEPRAAEGEPQQAPYGNLLDQPVVEKGKR